MQEGVCGQASVQGIEGWVQPCRFTCVTADLTSHRGPSHVVDVSQRATCCLEGEGEGWGTRRPEGLEQTTVLVAAPVERREYK